MPSATPCSSVSLAPRGGGVGGDKSSADPAPQSLSESPPEAWPDPLHDLLPDFVQHANFLIQSTDPTGRLRYVNAAWCRTLGYTTADVAAGLSLADVIAPECLAACRAAFARVLAGETVTEVEAVFVAKDGRRVAVSGEANARLDAAGRPEGTRGIFRDVTAERAAEAAHRHTQARLAASEAELRALFAAMRDVVLVLDREGTYVRVVPTAPDLLYRPAAELEGRRMHDVLPAEAADRFVGVIRRVLATGAPEALEYTLDLAAGRTWYAATVSPLGVEAGAGTVLWVARDVSARKRSEAALQLLQAVTHAIGAAEDADAAFRVALEMLCDASGWAYGEVWVPAPDGKALVHGPAWCRSGDPRLEAFARASDAYRFAPGAGLPGRVWAERAPVWLPDLEDAVLVPDFPRRTHARAAGLRAGVGVPVLAEGEVMAVLTFHAGAPAAADAGHVAQLAAVAAQVGGVVRRKRAEDAVRAGAAALRELATRDDLTGLLNRRGFLPAAEQARRIGRRTGRPDAVLYVDLDAFKPINDTHGHAEGDAALRAVADVLRGAVREGDLVARLGGDEFAVYAAGLTQAEDGHALAARLRAALAAHNVAAAGRPYALGFSVGVAETAPGDDLDALLARADAALYAAKAGRAVTRR